jgi:uncharacterized repeat protein (TIGR01451 family)
LNNPQGIAVDAAVNVYIADSFNSRIRKVSPNGIITTVAGTGACCGFSGDGGPATSAQLNNPLAVAADRFGNLYIADTNNYRIRQISPSGTISTVAGTGSQGYSGDGGPATSAQIGYVRGLAVDGTGNVYLADSCRIRQIAPNGTITTVAGNGYCSYSGDGGPATSAGISPLGAAVDGAGNLYIADGNNYRIRKVTPAGIISTLAGNGSLGFSGDGGAAGNAQLSFVQGIAIDSSGNLFLADTGNERIRKVALGTITTVAGGAVGDGGPALFATLEGPEGLVRDGSGNLYIADAANHRVRKIAIDGTISTVAGNGAGGLSGDNGPATSAQLYQPTAIALGNNSLYIADTGNYRVRRVDFSNGNISTFAGSNCCGNLGDNGPATSATLQPVGLAVDSSGNVYIADQRNDRIRKVVAGTISTFAGTGTQGNGGDGGQAVNAQFSGLGAMVVYGAGANEALYLIDSCRIRTIVLSTGIITTVAGTGGCGYSGDGGPPTSAQLQSPYGLAFDASGNLDISENGHVRQVSSGTILTVAGGGCCYPGYPGYPGDGGLASNAYFYGSGIAVDAAGRIYLADAQRGAVRMILPGGAPLLTIQSTHSGGLTVGQSGTYTVTVSNAAFSASTSGTVTVTETLPAGIAINSMSGSGWNCPGGNTCTRSDVLAAGSSYPAITVTVTPGSGAWPQVTNEVTVSGGGAANAGGVDFTLIALTNPPQIVSGSPVLATSTPQPFTVVARDPDGYTDLNIIFFLVASTPVVGQSSCHGFYVRSQNALYLYNDNLSQALGPLTPGSSGKLQNSQCVLDGTTSSLGSASGTDLTFVFGLGLLGTYKNTTQNVYFFALDNENHSTGWIKTSMWTLATNIPSVVSGTPVSVTGASQTFTFVARDLDGNSDIARVYFLIAKSASVAQNTCHGLYDTASNAFFLYDDSLTTALGPLTSGSSGTLQNSQCVLYGKGSSASASGTDLTLKIPFALLGGYGASENVYLWVQDKENNNTGWVQTGTWTENNGPPQVVSGSPSKAIVSPQTFSFLTSDPNGYADINVIYFLVASTPAVAQNSCHGFYLRAQNALYLYNDKLTQAMGPITPGTAGTLQNSQCVLNGATSSAVSLSANTFTLNLGLGLLGLYASSNQNVYLWVLTNGGQNTGWVQTSTWNLATHPPAVVSGAPTNATTTPQTFTFVAGDGDGYADINTVYFLVAGSPSLTPNVCHGLYNRATNSIYLYNDALTAALGPAVPGTAGTLQNSQCVVYPALSSLVSVSGSNLTLNLAIGLIGAFATTNQKVYLWVSDNEGNNTGWVQTSTWTLATHPPSVVSGTPTSPTTTPQTFTFIARDPDGYPDISNVYFLVNSTTAITQNTCHGYYNRASNALYLYNDTLTAVLGPLTPGSSGSIQNSQCVISGGTSSLVSASGTDLTVNIGIGLLGSYASAKNIYLWVQDNEDNNTGWVQTGSWVLSLGVPPSVASLSPTSSTVTPQTFTVSATDLDGFTDIANVYFLVSTSPTVSTFSCQGYYNRGANTLYLYSDSNALLGPITPGSASSLQNSQCAIFGNTSSLVSGSGATLTFNIGLGLLGTYANTLKNVYIWAQDAENHNTGWVLMGAWQ